MNIDQRTEALQRQREAARVESRRRRAKLHWEILRHSLTRLTIDDLADILMDARPDALQQATIVELSRRAGLTETDSTAESESIR